MSSTFASKTLPLSYTCCTLMPYSNGLMPIFVRSTACDAVTLVPSVTTFTSAINSTEPLTILVGILRVWKKFVDDGSKPVGPCGKKTSRIATVPAFAGAWRLFSVRMVRTSSMSLWQKTKPQTEKEQAVKYKTQEFKGLDKSITDLTGDKDTVQ